MDSNQKQAASGKPPAANSKKRKEAPSAATGNNKNQNQNQQQGKDSRPPSSRPQKRVKFQDARNIRSQPSDAALDSDGKLDLQKFLNAREFEIKALETSMRKCKAANATRVFQQVPREMRRRTASHNAKRVPKRLRDRAKREMLEDNTPTVESRKRKPRTTRARIRAENAKRLERLAAKKRKRALEKDKAGEGETKDAPGKTTIRTRAPRPKIRRDTLNEPPKIKSKFKKRQINKTWLPTHLWHAKRATMTEPTKPLWRFAIPMTPTQKCYRPTHRASGQKGTMFWDTSYMSTARVYGTAGGIEQVLKALGLAQESLWGNRGRKWRAGTRTWSGMVSRQQGSSRRDVGPATILWNPTPTDKTSAPESSTAEPKKIQRQVLIRTHPACFLELFEELVRLAKLQTPQIHVEDLRFEIGSIELTGPGSTETLLAVLQPYHTDERHGQVFSSLVGVTNPASLPKDAVLGFSVKDPRLSYPPKRVDTASKVSDLALLETLTQWPVEEQVKPYALFDRDVRFKASNLPPQKSINRRKGANIPGREIQVTAADPPIPVIVFASRPATGGQAQGTWTLLAPWKCILPIWYSIVHYPLSTGGNPRLGGLNEQRQIAFEQGTAWFPGDFLGTNAGVVWEMEQRAQRKAAWDRRPKGKRIEWASLDLGAGRKGEIGDGLACDFEHLFGLSKDPSSSSPSSSDSAGDESMTLNDDPNAMDVDQSREEATAASTKSGKDKDTLPSLATVQQMKKTEFNALISSKDSDSSRPPPRSIIPVNITFVTRGVANACARIYRLPSRPPSPSATTVPPSSTEAEVPATDPVAAGKVGSLPADLRDQWLQKLPSSNSSSKASKVSHAAPHIPPNVDLSTRKQLMAKSLLSGNPLPYPKPSSVGINGGDHPLCPGEEDLIGFVTAGAYSLSEGKGTAVGAISAEKALDTLKEFGAKEGRLCVVRNAGESVGWLGRWEVI
ncbi:ribonucleases P/MRP protein subunit POP1-domain-containing protein [Sordaria brevicollis]|uniref:Ribonucleases P/MRP protein subunit POP1-domain-containing protein n=1 Tax=Sordaria brevicollis TaxID=83679 RepID=A0AAE0P8X0_SORBR|nr:ribonucleases P/MRP protein subunit POP1-domain-containing protein [Sordaria brevicollis]